MKPDFVDLERAIKTAERLLKLSPTYYGPFRYGASYAESDFKILAETFMALVEGEHPVCDAVKREKAK